MELPELGKVQDLDSPHSKDTYRTVKPPDRCVISYNFEQNNSLNFTHNLLIGMFNDSTKKVSKNQSLNTLEHPKNKLFSILPNTKKIIRQEGNTIAKVYDSKVLPKKYVNPISPQKQRLESQTDYKQPLKTQLQNTNEDFRRQKNMEINDQDLTLQHQNSPLLSKMPAFNENKQRKLSPYNSQPVLKKQKTLNRSKIQDNQKRQAKFQQGNTDNAKQQSTKNAKFAHHSQQGAENEDRQGHRNLFQDRNNQSISKPIKKVANTFYIKQKENQRRRQFNNDNTKKQTHKNNSAQKKMESHSKSNSPIRNHQNSEYRNQTSGQQQTKQNSSKLEEGMLDERLLGKHDKSQFSLNQPEGTEEHFNRNSIQFASEKQSLEKQASLKTQQKIMTKKEIQDEQLKQLQQKIRKEEPGNFKKGYFKISKQSKEVLPFNADVQPLLKDPQNKQIKKTSSSSKLINERAAKTNGFNHENSKINNKANSTFQKTQSFSKNMPNRRQTFSHDKAGSTNGTIHQVKQAKAKEYSMNELAKANKGSVNPSQDLKNNPNSLNASHRTNQIKKLSSNLVGDKKMLKRNSYKKGNFKNDEKKTFQEQKQPLNANQNADLTQNNLIKGFKVVPEVQKNKTSFNTLNKSNSQQNPKNQAGNSSNPNKQVNRNYKKAEPNLNNNAANESKKQLLQFSKDKSQKKEKGKDQKSLARQNRETLKNRLSNDTSRTVKMNNHIKPSKQIDQSQNQQQRSRRGPKTEQSMSSPPKPTVPRQSKDKSYYFKNWREVELQKAMNQKKVAKKRRQSKLNLQKKMEKARKSSHLKPKRESKTAEIDLDAQQEDKFGLLGHKNATNTKKKSSKARNLSKKDKKKQANNSQIGQIKQQSQGTIKSNSQENSEDESEKEDNENSSIQQGSQVQFQKHSEKDNRENSSLQPKLYISPSLQGQNMKAEALNQQPHHQQCKEQEKVSQGVHEIQQLIEQNGQLSRINSINDALQDQKMTQKAKSSKQDIEGQQEHLSIMPVVCNNQNNLEELLIATQQVPPHNKSLQPILDDVQLQLQSNEQGDKSNKQAGKAKKLKQDQDQERKAAQQLQVNLPVPKLQFTEPVPVQKVLSRAGQQNETDYQEEQLDGIGEIPQPEAIKEENNKTQDFFQFNLKETSKISDTINLTANITKYQAVDKNITHYDRAPILSFLYEMPNQFENFNVPFFPSSLAHQLLKNPKLSPDIQEQIINQAVSILMSIDPWIIQRIFEPYQDKNGNIGVWLYCHGKWTLFLEKKEANFRRILHKIVLKAVELLNVKLELEVVLKIVSGVRIMRLKSNKKRVFTQLQFSLKKGHVLKALTSKQSKWGQRLFTVGNVQVTKDLENVLQIKEQGQTYWVKQQKFKQIFQHFLLICVRKSHFWTNRFIQHKPSHKTVISLASNIPAHGSITLFYPSTAPTSLLLYKELQTKVLKYMGKIEQKNNQNGNLYFQFRLHGSYSLFLQAPEDCLVAIESTAQLQISQPEYIVSQTLKNSECEYVQLTNQIRRKSNSKQPNRNGETLQRLREKFINLVAKK